MNLSRISKDNAGFWDVLYMEEDWEVFASQMKQRKQAQKIHCSPIFRCPVQMQMYIYSYALTHIQFKPKNAKDFSPSLVLVFS